jgi:drug/metabolite transporter (DMT)-like permease
VASLVGSLSYAISYVYMDRFLVSRRVSPLGLSAAQLLTGSAMTALAIPVTRDWNVHEWRADSVVSLIALGAVSTGIAYVLNYRIITDDGATAASVVTYLLPIVAAVLGAVVLGETLPLHATVGMLVILTGVGLARQGISRRQPKAVERQRRR